MIRRQAYHPTRAFIQHASQPIAHRSERLSVSWQFDVRELANLPQQMLLALIQQIYHVNYEALSNMFPGSFILIIFVL